MKLLMRVQVWALLMALLATPFWLTGCNVAQGADEPGAAAAALALSLAQHDRFDVVDNVPAPSLHCGGDKVITHGDGHTTPCPGCEDCQNKQSQFPTLDELIKPAAFVRVKRVTRAEPVDVALDETCADGTCAPEVASEGECACTEADGACACTTMTTTRTRTRRFASGSCASGDCASGAGLQAGGPLRRAAGAFRERRPVRRLFGRLLGRGCG